MDQQSIAATSQQRILAAGKSWQKVLGVATSACVDDVKAAFRKLVLLHHPDKPYGDSDTFKCVHEAYVLGLRKSRKLPCIKPPKPPKPPKPATQLKPKVKVDARVRSSGIRQEAPSTAPVAAPASRPSRPEDFCPDAAPRPQKRSRQRVWALPADAGKAKISKAVEQWVSAGGQDTTMPDEVRIVQPEKLADWIRTASCVPLDVRDVDVKSSAAAMKGAEFLSYRQLFSCPDEMAAKVIEIRKRGERVVLFSESGGRMGRCGLVGALLIDVFAFEENVVWRLQDGYVAWDSWLESHRDVARSVEPLAMRLERRRVTASIGTKLKVDAAGEQGHLAPSAVPRASAGA